MSGLKDTLKGGWHPKGKTESWRSDFKGINQAGWIGKGKDASSSSVANDHISRPITALKDPALFGPPPKNVNYHGGAALPNQVTPNTTGLGTPLTSAEIQAMYLTEEEEAKRKAAAPPIPFRANTTGLSTTNLPPPPTRKDEVEERSRDIPLKTKPGLPPRIPPRKYSETASSPAALPSTSDPIIAEPPVHKGILNQSSISSLGAAGITVPGFGIGEKRPVSDPESRMSDSVSTKVGVPPNASHLGELQSKFSHLPLAKPSSEAPGQGTSLAQKKAAIRTAAAFHNDPRSVSFADVRNAASTANNFHERHGDQVAAGWKSANSLNKKYGLAEKIGEYSSATPHTPEHFTKPVKEMDESIVHKKIPPPPPKKKPQLSQGVENGPIPPPIPLASKPKPKVSDL